MSHVRSLVLILVTLLCGAPPAALGQEGAKSAEDSELRLAAKVGDRIELAIEASGYEPAQARATEARDGVERDGIEKLLAPLGPEVVRRFLAEFLWLTHLETKHKERTKEHAFVTVLRSRTPEAARELVRQLTRVGKLKDEEARKAGILLKVKYSDVHPPGTSLAVASVREYKSEVGSVRSVKIVFALGPSTVEVCLFAGGKPELKALTDRIIKQVRPLF